MWPANERRRYSVMSSLIGLAHTQNDPCKIKGVCVIFHNPVPNTSSPTYSWLVSSTEHHGEMVTISRGLYQAIIFSTWQLPLFWFVLNVFWHTHDLGHKLGWVQIAASHLIKFAFNSSLISLRYTLLLKFWHFYPEPIQVGVFLMPCVVCLSILPSLV